eukprot:c26988_g1_i1 orf=723-2252(-)
MGEIQEERLVVALGTSTSMELPRVGSTSVVEDRGDISDMGRMCDTPDEGRESLEDSSYRKMKSLSASLDSREDGFGSETLGKEGTEGGGVSGSGNLKRKAEIAENDAEELREVADLRVKDDAVHDKEVADRVDQGCLNFLKDPPEQDDGTLEEQMAFVRELENFFSERNMEYKPPKFYGLNLNCLKLWRTVVRLGGYESVTNGKLWRQVGETFNPPRTCTTVSWSFRGFYEKALLDYENFRLHGIQPNVNQGTVSIEVPLQGSDAIATNVCGSLQPSPASIPTSGRARRDAAARAMQGWHSQRFLGNGEVGDPIIKDKASSSAAKREKQLKNIGFLKKKKPSTLERAVKAARTKVVRSQFLDHSPAENGSDMRKPSIIEAQRKKIVKQEKSRQLLKGGSYNPFSRMDVFIVDEGPPADWVKINVHKTRDCFEVYALVPGLLREEVRIQCEPGGQLVIAGEPEQPDNPWGVTPFKRVVNLPLPIDVHLTSAVVTLHGQLFIRVPFAQQDL